MFRFFLVALLCAWPLNWLLAKGPAGILLYFRNGDEVYLLLADHVADKGQVRGWASFGGGEKEGESAAETAARETEEETRGYFKRSWLLEKIRNQTPFDDGLFSCFFLEIDFVPIPLIENHPLPTKEPDFAERGPYAWIPFSQVAVCLDPNFSPNAKGIIPAEYLPSGVRTSWFWSVWLQNLRAARARSPLPWETAANRAEPIANGVTK